MARILSGGGQDGSGNPTTATVGRPGFRKFTRTFFQSVRRVNKNDPADGFLNSAIRDVPLLGLGTHASLTTNLTNATNNDLVFTAKEPGEEGNDITIAYVDPGGTTATLGIVVTGTDIVVNLGRAASTINTTGDLLKAAIAASAAASALVSVEDKAGNDGSGLVAALSETPLAGGAEGEMRGALPPSLATAPSTPQRMGADQKPLEPTVRVPNRRSSVRVR